EYYITRTELGILRAHADELSTLLGRRVCLIEPGSGSGEKTRLMLSILRDPAAYVPIDISREQLEEASAALAREFPDVEIRPVCADFTDDFEIPDDDIDGVRRIVFFPGSTIGNLLRSDAIALLRRMRVVCSPRGGVLIGVDRKKKLDVLLPAYDDSAGVSAEFALNYLRRLNRELDATFDPESFEYDARYDERNGRIEMALVSRCDQTVRVAGRQVRLRTNERIRTEYSHKFDLNEFSDLARQARFRVARVWSDADDLFSVHFLEPE
ncbi:MAG: L-histidine N(alpha)-methyltransferase, partial [Planctomycetota bacterium]